MAGVTVVERDVDDEVRVQLPRALLQAGEGVLFVAHLARDLDGAENVVGATAQEIAAAHGHSREMRLLTPVAVTEIDAHHHLGAELGGASLQLDERLLGGLDVFVDVHEAEHLRSTTEIHVRANVDAGGREIQLWIRRATPCGDVRAVARLGVLRFMGMR